MRCSKENVVWFSAMPDVINPIDTLTRLVASRNIRMFAKRILTGRPRLRWGCYEMQ